MNGPELRDIHLPDVILWWPPALGWWMLAIVILLLVAGLMVLRRWLKQQSVKRRSLVEFRQIIQSFEDQQDSARLLQQVSTLLRRILITYLGRDQAAAVTGDRWVEALNGLVAEHCFNEEQEGLLRQGQFQRDFKFDRLDLINSCERWIKALPRSQNHASV